MQLANLFDILFSKLYILNFYDGNEEGECKDEVIVTCEKALDYKDYMVHVIHGFDGRIAVITLRSKDYG